MSPSVVKKCYFVSDYSTYYHHTDRDSAKKILESGKILQSVQQSKNDDAAHGDGTYLTKIGASASRIDVAKNNYDGTTNYYQSKKSKADVAIEVKVSNSKVQNYSTPDRSVYKYDGDLDLKDAQELKVHVRDKKGGYQTFTPK